MDASFENVDGHCWALTCQNNPIKVKTSALGLIIATNTTEQSKAKNRP